MVIYDKYFIMYLENKYTKWYQNIIAAAQSRSNVTGYRERHHIRPKSLGGTDLPENIVELTAREHFICHILLIRMTSGEEKRKMVYAAWAFNRKSKNQDRSSISSRTYETLRQQYASVQSVNRKGKQGKKHSEETKALLSNMFAGKPKSEETKRKMRESWKSRPPRSQSHRDALSAASKGRVISDETRKKMSESHRGIAPIHVKIPFVCEHCGKNGVGMGNYKRWHGDNCKAASK